MHGDRRYRWLLRLLPGAFREDHQRELLRAWRDEAGEAAREGRRGVWRSALVDTLRVAPGQFAEVWTRNLVVAIRSLRRSPAFALTAILTLALGTGAASAVFTLVNGVLLRPLPWPSPERVGVIRPIQPSGEQTWLSVPELKDLEHELAPVATLAGLADLRPTWLAGGVGHEVQALAVSHPFFDVLGVGPTLGRDFIAADDREGAAPVALLGHEFWRARFGADPAVVGRTIVLDEKRYAIIGVLPAGFSLLPASSVMPAAVDLWLPLEPHLAARERTVRFLHVLARLRPGATYAEADTRLASYASRVTTEFAGAYRGGTWRFSVVPFKDHVLGATGTVLYLMLGLVALVLVMACANVANLLLARGEARRAELAMRTALGAGPARLAGELAAEALVLAAAGSAAGLAAAALTPGLLRAIDPGALPRLADVRLDGNVLVFALALVFVSGAIAASVPMFDRLRLQEVGLLSPNRAAGPTRRTSWIGATLVVVQTALATSVLVTATLLTLTYARLQSEPPGFAVADRLTGRISLSQRYATGADVVRFFDAAVVAVLRSPGVRDAAAITQLPLSGAMLGSTFLVGGGDDAGRVDADLRGITAGYFEVAGVPLLRGRAFSRADGAASAPVAIVDQTFARRLSGDGDVVGRRIRWYRQPDVELEIVGVVGATRHRGPGEPSRETVYRPHTQYPRGTMFVVARTDGTHPMSAATLRSAIDRVDPSQPIADMSTMAERYARSMARARTSLMLAVALATLALLLGIVGIHGVLSLTVRRRIREFGVRMALGATRGGVTRLVLRQGLTLTSVGLLCGLVVAGTLSRVAGPAVTGTDPTDVRGYGAAALIVLAASALAFLLPALRASRADPAESMRVE